jgi:hypothetical protein
VTYSFSGLQAGFQFDVSDDRRGVLTFTARTAGTALPEPGLPALLGLAGLAAWATRRRQPGSASLPETMPERMAGIDSFAVTSLFSAKKFSA